MMPLPAALLWCEAIQIPNGANQQPVTGNGGRGHDNFLHVVAGDYFEVDSCFKDSDFALFTREINVPTGCDSGG